MYQISNNSNLSFSTQLLSRFRKIPVGLHVGEIDQLIAEDRRRRPKKKNKKKQGKKQTNEQKTLLLRLFGRFMLVSLGILFA